MESGHHHHHDHEKPMTAEEAARSLLVLGQVAQASGDYESAVEAYASLLKLEQNEAALYNLASFYARGLGCRQDYVEAARLFHQAELMGNERAGKLCGKCMLDYLQDGADAKTPADLYAAMGVFVTRVYPEATEPQQEVSRGLFAVANALLNKGACSEAAKVFRAGAEYCNDGYAQYYLAMLYNTGSGVSKNDLVALYWLDCAADNGAEDGASEERDGLLGALRQGLGADQFKQAMAMLSTWCETGTADIPANSAKADLWHKLAQ